MKMYNISIPKPCHEDWNKMSPEERGRFCDKCSKCVLDFTTSTEEQINDFIEKHEGEKLCGRFRNDQIECPVILNVSKQFYQQRLSFLQAFIVSLLVAFGTTLFSCTTHHDEKVGEIRLDSKQKSLSMLPDSIHRNSFGFFLSTRINSEKAEIKNTEVFKEKFQDTIQLSDVFINSSSVNFQSCDFRTVGLISTTISPPQIPDSAETVSDSLKTEDRTTAEIANDFLEIYPNPSSGFVKLKINNLQDAKLKCWLYDLNGRMVKILSDQEFPAGENISEYDLSDLENGNYIISVTGNNFNKTSMVILLK
jgi:hypothetical protein